MKPDLYTKAVLTVVAIMLAVIVFRLPNGEVTVKAQAPTGLQFSYTPEGPAFFDPATGDIWRYTDTQRANDNGGELIRHYRLIQPGQPLTFVR